MEVKQHEANKLARDVYEYAKKKGYGLGECGYYFREWAGDYTDNQDPEYLKALSLKAKEIADKLEELDV